MATELTLEPTPQLPRRLRLTLTDSGENLSVRMLLGDREAAYSTGAFKDWYLDFAGLMLWHQHSGFDLTLEEAKRVRETFAPHGLILFPAAAPIGPESAKAAAQAVPPPSERGTSRPPDCSVRTGGRALDMEVRPLEYALANGECF